MAATKCGLCGTPHGPFETCFIAHAPYYAFASEWLTEHPRDGGKWEVCWVVPLSSKRDCSILWAYFTHVWDYKHIGGSEKMPCKNRQNRIVYCYCSGKPEWTIVYRWAPELLVEALAMKDRLLAERHRVTGL